MSANWARFRQMCSDNVCRRCGKVTETIEVLLGFFVSKVLCDKCFEEKQKEAAIAEAQGQAEAIRILQEQLTASPQYIELLKAQKWDGKLPQVTGGAIPMISIGG